MGVGTGLDAGTDSVKVVKVRTGPGGVSILSAAKVTRRADGAFPAGEVAHAIRRAGLPRRAACGVSGKDLMLRYIAVPPVPPWRLKMLVDFEIRENMAGGGTDITSDYRPLNLPTGLEQGIVVLAAVAKNAYLEESFANARSAGVKVTKATPSAVALYRAFAVSRELRDGETVFLLDIGREKVEMAVQKDGELLFARNAAGIGGERTTQVIDGAFGIGRDRAESYKRERARVSLQPPADADKRQLLVYGALREAGDAIVGTVSTALRFARMQTKMQDLDFDRLVLSGGGSRLAGLKEFLESRLERPVTLFDPEAALDSSRLRGPEAALFGGAPSEMTVATGLAVLDAESEGFSLSLLPPREAARRRFRSRTVFGYAVGAAAAVLAGAMFVRARADLANATRAREELTSEVELLRGRAREVKSLEDENRRAREELSLFLEEAKVNRAVLEFLALQRETCPGGLSLTKLALVDAAELRVEFEGRARGMNEPAFLSKLEEFQKGLSASPLVRSGSVSISSIRVRARKPEADARAFRCAVTLEPWAAPEAPAAEEAPEAAGPGETEGGDE